MCAVQLAKHNVTFRTQWPLEEIRDCGASNVVTFTHFISIAPMLQCRRNQIGQVGDFRKYREDRSGDIVRLCLTVGSGDIASGQTK